MKVYSVFQKKEKDFMKEKNNKYFRYLSKVINHSVKVLAVVVFFEIVRGGGDIFGGLYKLMLSPSESLLNITGLLATMGRLLVMISVITAVLAVIARTAIMWTFKIIESPHIYAVEFVVLALSVRLWLTDFLMNEIKHAKLSSRDL